MSHRSNKARDEARKVADKLRSQGNHFDADAIMRLVRSHMSSTLTCEQLHRDNLELRKLIGEKTEVSRC